MEIREIIIDLVLTVIMVVSTLVLVLRLREDWVLAAAAILMMLSLGGLFLLLNARITNLENTVLARERALKSNLQEMYHRISEKNDETVAHMDDVVEALSKRVYR